MAALVALMALAALVALVTFATFVTAAAATTRRGNAVFQPLHLEHTRTHLVSPKNGKDRELTGSTIIEMTRMSISRSVGSRLLPQTLRHHPASTQFTAKRERNGRVAR